MVKYNGAESKPIYVSSGVPQGSHLGPLLFLIFIDPLTKVCSKCDKLSYADDSKYFRTIRDINDCSVFQEEINRISKWCDNNLLQLNISKCKIITFSRVNNPLIFTYKINDIPLERTECINDLGVIMDPKLTFIPHIENITAKAYQRLFLIKKFSLEFNDIFITKLLYVSLIRLRVKYGVLRINVILIV